MRVAFALVSTAVMSASASGAPPLVRFPTVSASQIAFVAEGDLWIMPTAGGRATRLTRDPGQVLAPRFAPDGKSIAFTWRKGGGNDVYLVSATGGTPRRLTHGPSADPYDNFVTGWTPDGRNVLFLSQRANPFRRPDTFEVSVTGELARPLDLGHSGLSSLSPDGTLIAFDWSFRNLGDDRWKRYRGGEAGEIFIYDASRRRIERMTKWRGIDTAPMWVGGRIYFLSDRGPEGRLNIWVSDVATKAVRQITRYSDYDIDMPSVGPGGIAFQEGGRLRLLDLSSERVRDVPVALPDEAEETTKRIAAAPFVARQDVVHQADYALGLDGLSVLAARGDLYTMSREGVWTDLTSTPGSVEDHPAISPDGRTVAFVTDANGEQQVATLPLTGLGRPHVLTRFRSGVLYAPRWSPDGRRISVADAGKRLWLIDAAGSGAIQIAFDPYAEIQDAAFSADGRWLAYSVTRENQTRALHLRDLSNGRDVVLSDAMESDHDPAFSADGRTLFFASERRERPFASDRDREGTIATFGSEGLYRASLPSADDDPRSFVRSTTEMQIGLVGGIASPEMRGSDLFYRAKAIEDLNGGALPGQSDSLHVLDVASGKDRVIATEAEGYSLSPDARSALIGGSGGFRVVATVGKGTPDREVSLAAARIAVDPEAERREMFEQAWRLDRDLFWDPALHGRDWPAMHRLYAPLAQQARSHEDMIYVLGELQGELGASHMFVGGGDSGDPRPPTTTALLGTDFEVDRSSSRYRLSHIYRGDDSRARFRAPLGDPALDVRDGDYLLAVDGQQLMAPDDPYRLLADRKGPLVIEIARTADGPSRSVTVDPVESEVQIRKLDWIASRRALVDKVSGGRVGYVYLTDFDELGAEDFLRQFYPQTDKTGLVIDDRDNWGGFTSQWSLDVLRRSQAGIFVNREGGRTTLPAALAPRRMATVINIFSSSDGDQFPYFFREWRMGLVVGQRTWGGVRGIKGRRPLVDGTTVTVPKDSLLDPQGADIIENVGAEPDIEVEDGPASFSENQDPQLERAVAELLKSNGTTRARPDHSEQGNTSP